MAILLHKKLILLILVLQLKLKPTNMEQPNVNLFDLQLDQMGSMYLKETGKWARFLSIVGFIICGLMVLIAVFAGSFIANSLSQAGGGAMAQGLGGFITVLYLIVALLCFFPCLYLFNFSTKMKIAIANNDLENLNASFRNLKSYFKFIGILTIIMLAFWVLAILLNIAAFSAMM